MLKDYQLRLFIRVVSRRMEEEGKTVDEVLNEYPLLTEEDKEKIKAGIGGE